MKDDLSARILHPASFYIMPCPSVAKQLPMRSLLHALLLIFGTLAALPLLAVLLLLPTTPITFVGLLYLLGCILIVSGMISARWWRRSAILALLGTSLLLVTLAVRMIFPPSGTRLVLT